MSRFFLFAAALLVVSACDSNDPENTTTADLTVQTVTDVFAPLAEQPPGPPQPPTGPFVYYSLRTNTVVADSNSTAWDLAFRGTEIRANGGTSGPGTGAAIVVNNTFAEITEAPADSEFRVDGSGTCPNGSVLAICTGGGNGWYTYTGQVTNLILPTAGRTILVRTGDGQGYAKVQIRSYYRGAPATPDANSDESRYYTFDYVLNPNGRTFSVNS